jgi:hypothetical protein
LTEKLKFEEELKKIMKKEKEIEEELWALEEEEKMVKETERKIEVEKERQEVEKERRETEKERWELEQRMKTFEEKEENLKKEEEKIDQKIEDLKKKIEEIEKKLPRELIEEIEKPEIEEEKVEFEIPKIEERPEVPEIEEKPEIKIEKLPKKPPKILRPLVRVLISIFFLFFISSSIWFFVSKKITKKPVQVPPPEIPSPTPLTEEIQKPEILIPPAIISFDFEKEIEIKEKEEIEKKILEELGSEIEEGGMERVVIKNLSENRLINLKEILDAFQIWSPEGILEKVESFDLGIYSQKEGKRIILVAKIKEGEKLDELKDWEGKIEKEGVFVSGKKITTLYKKFRGISIKGEGVRFLTISRNDLGICYSLINNYFVFSESLNGMEKVIEKIKK